LKLYYKIAIWQKIIFLPEHFVSSGIFGEIIRQIGERDYWQIFGKDKSIICLCQGLLPCIG
jgi:predicted helicase